MPALYQTNKDVPEEYLLGNILFYNLTDMTVPETDLLDVFQRNGMPQGYIRKISHADAFRRATSSIKNEKVDYVDDNGDTFEGRINVDEVVNDKMYIKRIVGVRVLNDQKEEVSYTQLGAITYDRMNDSCSIHLQADSLNHVTVINVLLNKATSRYTVWSAYHNHDTVKNIINRIVDAMHPVALMPTGMCKFIPKTSNQILYALEGVVRELSDYSDDGMSHNTVEIIPVLDTQEQRSLIQDMYEEEIKESLYEYSQEMAEVLRKRQTLTSKQAASYLEKFKELKDKVTDYEGLLNTYTASIQEQLKIAFQQIEDNKEA